MNIFKFVLFVSVIFVVLINSNMMFVVEDVIEVDKLIEII